MRAGAYTRRAGAERRGAHAAPPSSVAAAGVPYRVHRLDGDEQGVAGTAQCIELFVRALNPCCPVPCEASRAAVKCASSAGGSGGARLDDSRRPVSARPDVAPSATGHAQPTGPRWTRARRAGSVVGNARNDGVGGSIPPSASYVSLREQGHSGASGWRFCAGGHVDAASRLSISSRRFVRRPQRSRHPSSCTFVRSVWACRGMIAVMNAASATGGPPPSSARGARPRPRRGPRRAQRRVPGSGLAREVGLRGDGHEDHVGQRGDPDWRTSRASQYGIGASAATK